MISRAAFDRYNRAVDTIGRAASVTARQRISAWMAANPDATVAETREAAIGIVDGVTQVSSDASASAAAWLYDEVARMAREDLPAAVTATVYSPEAVEEAVHTMARHLDNGDAEAFLRACGLYAEDKAKRSANQTMLTNATRDAKRGVRFARVPTGAETCSWCYMLATRGADYLSRESAGEIDKFHRKCDCKVVPGFESNKYAELVEGWRPDEAYARMKEIERQTGLRFGSDSKQMTALTREMEGMDRDWIFRGRGSFSWTPYRVRTAKHRNGDPYSDEEKKIASEIERHGADGSPFSSSDLDWTGRGFGRHVNTHGSEFGLDPSKKVDRDKYALIANDAIDNCDALAYGDWFGQNDSLCLFYCKGDTIVIVNAVTKTIVSVFRFERGRNERLTAVWDSVHERLAR